MTKNQFNGRIPFIAKMQIVPRWLQKISSYFAKSHRASSIYKKQPLDKEDQYKHDLFREST